jgi:hypothetical protein
MIFCCASSGSEEKVCCLPSCLTRLGSLLGFRLDGGPVTWGFVVGGAGLCALISGDVSVCAHREDWVGGAGGSDRAFFA